ncbi:hypothetical protein E4J66_07550 [Actinomyces viscosus]|nr:hypothetical protein E4J66_07550 [Actinomyces viscosus]
MADPAAGSGRRDNRPHRARPPLLDPCHLSSPEATRPHAPRTRPTAPAAPRAAPAAPRAARTAPTDPTAPTAPMTTPGVGRRRPATSEELHNGCTVSVIGST